MDKIQIPERLLKSKLKDRTILTHNKHIEEGNKSDFATTLVIGSSLIERFSTTGRVHLRDFKNNGIILAGVGGDGIQHVWWRIKNGQLIEKLTAPIDHVILMIGTNNIPYEKDTQKLALAVGEMYKYLKTKVTNVTVMELAPKSEPERPSYDITEMIRVYNKTLKKIIPYRDFAKNWWKELADENKNPKKEMYVDNVHFSSEGYKIVAKTLLNLVQQKKKELELKSKEESKKELIK